MWRRCHSAISADEAFASVHPGRKGVEPRSQWTAVSFATQGKLWAVREVMIQRETLEPQERQAGLIYTGCPRPAKATISKGKERNDLVRARVEGS